MDHTFFLHPWTVVPGTEVTPGWRKCWQFLMELSKHGVSPGEAPIPKGRLASKKEGAGKIRIFALANPLLQGMVRPIHDWLMTILSLIRSDGTLNQLRPLSFIRHRLEYYSFD